jgi:hypothetical protein
VSDGLDNPCIGKPDAPPPNSRPIASFGWIGSIAGKVWTVSGPGGIATVACDLPRAVKELLVIGCRTRIE